MYTPGFNKVTDRALLLEAMQSYSFAILIGPQSTAEAPAPLIATHLPLTVRDEGPHGLLQGHFAAGNPHWQLLAGREALAIFPGPHSYVSPSLYGDASAVPTWNYIAIHAYGTLELIEDKAGKEPVLKNLIRIHEPAFEQRWNEMPEGYRDSMLAGIVAFRIPIERIEGKFKISQNRAPGERAKVQAAHAAGDDDQHALAAWMARFDD